MNKKEAIKLGKAIWKNSKIVAKETYKFGKKVNKEMKKRKRKDNKIQRYIKESETQFDYKKWE